MTWATYRKMATVKAVRLESPQEIPLKCGRNGGAYDYVWTHAEVGQGGEVCKACKGTLAHVRTREGELVIPYPFYLLTDGEEGHYWPCDPKVFERSYCIKEVSGGR